MGIAGQAVAPPLLDTMVVHLPVDPAVFIRSSRKKFLRLRSVPFCTVFRGKELRACVPNEAAIHGG